MKSSVIVFPGSNCDRDIGVALKKFEIKNQMVWHNETNLPKSDLVVLPGGFSYGDYLRTGCIASKSPIINDVISLINCISHVPDANSIEELRLYRAVLGDRLDQQLICESALKTSLIQDVKSSLDSLPENRAGVSPIADGNWIAEVTGLSKGIKLGRLKEWLHRIQIEEDLVSLEEIESHINHLPCQEGNPTTWPRFRWP